MSKNRLILYFIFQFTFLVSGFSKDEPAYKASLISPELLKNAKAVVRESTTRIEVDGNIATEDHKLVITVLNKNGNDLSKFEEFYDAFIRINSINIRVFDSEGRKVKSFFGSDIIDHSAINGFSLYEDNRVKYLDPEYKNYPYTVEFTFGRKLKSLIFLPVWQVYCDYNCSVEKSMLAVELKNGTKIRYLERNVPQLCQVEEKNGTRTLTWFVSQLPAFSEESFEEPISEFTPFVCLSPEEFEVDGIKGSLKSWKEFGKWIVELNKNRDVLTPETTKKILDLTTGLTTNQKIQKIYEYMQHRTRYVSIQIGIGGWQPFEASTVDRLAYGDCKALSNYTYSLLRAVGINAFYTLIRAGEDAPPLKTSFPSQFFNHAILTVPVEKDTLFLECTNPFLPYGHIGSFTDDRYALTINDSCGKLIHTRIYKPEENTISSKIDVLLNQEGSGTAIAKMAFNGTHFDDVKYLSIQTDDDIKKKLYEGLNISNFSITSFSFDQPDKTVPTIIESLKIDLDRYASIVNNKLIIPLNFIHKVTEIPNITENRKSDIVIRRPSIEIDTVKYKIPVGYRLDKLPQEYSISSEFADYHSKCEVSNDTVVYIRKFILKTGRYKSTDANKFKDFYDKVCQADMSKLTVLK